MKYLVLALNKVNYWHILTVQMFTIFLLYFFLPGRVPVTLTAFQPDSINSVCMALNMFNASDVKIAEALLNIERHFYNVDFDLACSPEITPPYRVRLLLPFLMGLASLIGPWWTLFIPSVLIYLAIGFLTWNLVKQIPNPNWKVKGLALLPFLSPHIGWFLANIMTEGPVVLACMGILSLLYSRRKTSKVLLTSGVLLLAVFCLLSKQSWPIVMILLAIAFQRIYPNIKNTAAYILGLIVSISISELIKGIARDVYGNDFGKWNDTAVFLDPVNALIGVAKGLSHDFLHLFKFADIFGLVGISLAVAFVFGHQINVHFRVLLLICFAWGFATVGSVYLADGSYGQNWRFFVFANFLAFPIWILANSKDQVIERSEV
jgi:multisubunit Na+/H+ antiporter MnhG subunit